jgi:hypothetical protein
VAKAPCSSRLPRPGASATNLRSVPVRHPACLLQQQLLYTHPGSMQIGRRAPGRPPIETGALPSSLCSFASGAPSRRAPGSNPRQRKPLVPTAASGMTVSFLQSWPQLPLSRVPGVRGPQAVSSHQTRPQVIFPRGLTRQIAGGKEPTLPSLIPIAQRGRFALPLVASIQPVDRVSGTAAGRRAAVVLFSSCGWRRLGVPRVVALHACRRRSLRGATTGAREPVG